MSKKKKSEVLVVRSLEDRLGDLKRIQDLIDRDALKLDGLREEVKTVRARKKEHEGELAKLIHGIDQTDFAPKA